MIIRNTVGAPLSECWSFNKCAMLKCSVCWSIEDKCGFSYCWSFDEAVTWGVFDGIDWGIGR